MRVSILLLLPVATACSKPAPAPPLSAAADAFQHALQGELQTAIAKGGPPEGIAVCAERAPKIREEVEAKFGVHLGRTSIRRRNPLPKAPTWVTQWMDANPKGGPPIDDGVHLLRPLFAGDICLKCHGDRGTFSPELRAQLDAHYPGDQATGFQAGDLRGVLWVTREPL